MIRHIHFSPAFHALLKSKNLYFVVIATQFTKRILCCFGTKTLITFGSSTNNIFRHIILNHLGSRLGYI